MFDKTKVRCDEFLIFVKINHVFNLSVCFANNSLGYL